MRAQSTSLSIKPISQVLFETTSSFPKHPCPCGACSPFPQPSTLAGALVFFLLIKSVVEKKWFVQQQQNTPGRVGAVCGRDGKIMHMCVCVCDGYTDCFVVLVTVRPRLLPPFVVCVCGLDEASPQSQMCQHNLKFFFSSSFFFCSAQHFFSYRFYVCVCVCAYEKVFV